MDSNTEVPTVDVVIVAWGHEATLAACLRALDASSRESFVFDRVVVVDNDMSRPSRPPDDLTLPLQLVRNDVNAGFAPACNQGARGSTADYLLFLNPDACVGRDSIAHAVAWCSRSDADDVAVVGLPLADGTGVAQATCGQFPTARSACAQMLGVARLGWSWCRGFRMTEWDHDRSRPVDYVSGACLLVRRAVFEESGGFDDRFEIYLEDVDLCLRLTRRGWRTWFLAVDPVTHVSGWERGDARAWRLAHSWKSLLVYAWAHFPRPAAVAVAWCMATLAVPARLGAALLHRSWRDAVSGLGAGLWLVLLVVGSPVRRRPASEPRTSRGVPPPWVAEPTRSVPRTDAGAASRRSSESAS